VIAAVEGGAAGAGLSIALACDLILAGESAKFTAAYVKAGLVPDGGLTASLARSVPRALAAELCLLGQPLGAARLHALGVVNQIVADGAAFAAAQETADRLCAGPPEAQAAIKRLVSTAYEVDETTQMDHERDAMAYALGAPEAAEGIAAFFEKRKPSYPA
jgi:2-(1,2-epoxy-1,2-dihydrophenyl)acetyl-CoA isomerase